MGTRLVTTITIWACDLWFHASPCQDIAPSCIAWVRALLQPYSLRSPAQHRPDVSLSWALPQAFASSSILLPSGIRLAPPLYTESLWGLLRSPPPLFEPLGRRYPPGFVTVPTGQSYGCPRRILCHFGSSVSASSAGLQSRWLNHVFACAAHRFLLGERSG